MSNIVPEKSINFAVYLNGRDLLGLAEGTIPNLEAMTSEVKGAGVAGTLDTPVLGHFNSTTLSLTWRTTTDDFIKLARPMAHNLDLYASLQRYDAGLGIYKTEQLHVFVKAIPKNTTLGNLTVGDAMDTQMEFEIPYMKIWLGGRERVEMDKYNYIFKIDGVDYLAQTRADLAK